jgi:hypothetical protein
MDGTLMSADVGSEGETFRVGTVQPLFTIQPPQIGGPAFDVTTDGQRFLVIPSTVQQADTLLNLMVNWPEVLAARR